MIESKLSHIRILGKKSTNRQIAIYVKKLHSDNLTKREIADRLNASRPTVDKYLKFADALNIQTGFKKTTARSQVEINDKEFLENPYIADWIKSMNTRATAGKSFGGKTNHLTNVHNVCKSLKVNPETFLSANTNNEVLDIGRELLTNFIELYKKKETTVKIAKNWNVENISIAGAAYRYAQSLRDFMRCHGHAYPKGEGGIMSQSITQFHGKYAGLAISEEIVLKIKAELIDQYNLDSDEFRFFMFGLESMGRNKAIYNSLNDFEITTLKNGHLIYVMESIETKTSQYKDGKWSKHIWDKELQESIKLVSKRSQHVIEDRNYEKFMKLMIPILKEKYRKHGLTSQGQRKQGDPESSYFVKKPIHVLRHAGAQRLLLKTNWNIAYVSKRGWKTAQELIDSYGEMPASQELKTLEVFF